VEKITIYSQKAEETPTQLWKKSSLLNNVNQTFFFNPTKTLGLNPFYYKERRGFKLKYP
jgi:hypothetical protein